MADLSRFHQSLETGAVTGLEVEAWSQDHKAYDWQG